MHCKEKRTFESDDLEIYGEHNQAIYSMNRNPLFNKEDTSETLNQKFSKMLDKRYSISFRCTRDTDHTILYDLITTEKEIIKIGQFPSYASISVVNIEKYKSLLKDEFAEFSKAIGLFSHGIGIGSFVYLRRIIENLVYKMYENNKSELQIKENEFYYELSFKEKITSLEGYIPDFLVENRNLYSILSKGIHELSEEECKEYFPQLKLAIELILDDLLAKKIRRKKEKELSKFVAQTTGDLK